MEMIWWLYNRCVVLGICVPNMYLFTFLLVLWLEMALKQQAGSLRERGPRRTCYNFRNALFAKFSFN